MSAQQNIKISTLMCKYRPSMQCILNGDCSNCSFSCADSCNSQSSVEIEDMVGYDINQIDMPYLSSSKDNDNSKVIIEDSNSIKVIMAGKRRLYNKSNVKRINSNLHQKKLESILDEQIDFKQNSDNLIPMSVNQSLESQFISGLAFCNNNSSIIDNSVTNEDVLEFIEPNNQNISNLDLSDAKIFVQKEEKTYIAPLLSNISDALTSLWHRISKHKEDNSIFIVVKDDSNHYTNEFDFSKLREEYLNNLAKIFSNMYDCFISAINMHIFQILMIFGSSASLISYTLNFGLIRNYILI